MPDDGSRVYHAAIARPKMAGRMPPDRIMSGSNDSATSRDAVKLEILPLFAVPAASRASEHPDVEGTRYQPHYGIQERDRAVSSLRNTPRA